MSNGYIKITSAVTIGSRTYEAGTLLEVTAAEARGIFRKKAGVPIGPGGALLQSTRKAEEMRIGRAR